MQTKFLHSTLYIAILTSFAAPSFADVTNRTEKVELDKVVVTASGSAVDVKDAPASISVITKEDIERTPVTSVGELIGKVPGASGGEGLNAEGGEIKLRGLPSQYTLILIDGRRIGDSSRVSYRPDLGRQDLDWISPEATINDLL